MSAGYIDKDYSCPIWSKSYFFFPLREKGNLERKFSWTVLVGERMNKSDLIEQLAVTMQLSGREAAAIVDTILETMTDALTRGDSIEIRGFGSFVVKEYESYTGRNPKTGELITVRPKRLPFFKVGKDLREQVNRRV